MSPEWIKFDTLKEESIWSLVDPLGSSGYATLMPGSERTLFIKPLLEGGVKFQARLGAVSFSDVCVCRLNDALLKGADVVHVGGTPVFVEGFHPRYTFDLFPSGDDKRIGGQSMSVVRLDFPVAIISHWTSGTYGHFLMEMLPKVVAFNTLKTHMPALKLAISSYCGAAVLRILSCFVRESDILVYDYVNEAVSAPSVFLFQETIDRGAIHPFVSNFITLAHDRVLSADNDSKPTFNKIFLSKSRWRDKNSDYRVLANEDALSEQLRAEGFTTIYPEQMTWLHQVALFSCARIVVGEFTSALHNCLFSQPSASVIGLNYVNEIQDCIAAFRNHHLGYVLPTDGLARTWHHSTSDTKNQFEIDIESLMRYIKAAENVLN